MRVIPVIGLCLFVFSSVSAQQARVSLSRVDPPMGEQLPYNYPISFYFRVSNLTTYEFDEIVNGFRIYSPDGATWNPGFTVDTTSLGGFPVPVTTYDTTWYGEFINDGMPYPNLAWRPGGNRFHPIFGVFSSTPVVGSHSAGGRDADTVWFTGVQNALDNDALGIFPGLAIDPGWVIRIESIDSSSVGKSICLDSSFYRPSGAWVWSTSGEYGNIDLPPEWNGPHCFEVVDCCVGRRGNVDLTYSDINIADLTGLIRQVFVKNQLRCLIASNVDWDANETVDISDLVYLTDYMFRGGPEPPACP